MTFRPLPILRSALLACCLATAFPAARAADAGAAVGTSVTTEARLSAEFAGFLGGEEEAAVVVSGLRQGTAFSLDAAPGTPGTIIDPPTGTMGYGNVRITLRLAQAQLSKLGITQPTSGELSAVLLGGEINGTPVDGILALRADGMGWGQIAQKYGMTVGQLMGKGSGLGKQTGNATTASGTAASGNATSKSGQAPQGRANGYIPSGGQSHGAGIVSAAGGSMSGAAQGGGKGKVSAAGQGAGGQHAATPGVSGSVGGGGAAKAMAPGQINKP